MTVAPLPERDQSGGRVMVTSQYGARWGHVHRGTDLGTTDGIEIGVEVHANESGTVIRTSRDPGQGAGLNMWLLTNRVVTDGWGRRCRVGYKNFHLARIIVGAGPVAEGQHIADVGMSGTSAAHLHQQKHLVPERPGIDPVNWDWSDNTSVSHTDELQQLIRTGCFPGKTPPAPPPSEDDDVTPQDVETIAQHVAVLLTNVTDGTPAPYPQNLAHIVEQLNALLRATTAQVDVAQIVIDELGPNSNGTNAYSIVANQELLKQVLERLGAIEAKLA